MNIFEIPDSDIQLFISSVNKDLLNGVNKNPKIQHYVMFLKTIQHYRSNGIMLDVFILKRNNMDESDITKIYNLLDRLKKGKNLNHRVLTNVKNNTPLNMNINYASFNIKEPECLTPKFEMAERLQPALLAYHEKMRKVKEKNMNKNSVNNRIWNNEQNPYTSDYSNIQNVQNFSTAPLVNNDEQVLNTILNLDRFNNFNDPYEIKTPLISNKRNHYKNSLDTRFQQNILQNTECLGFGNTRNKGVVNKEPFENQYEYIDPNYNRVLNDTMQSYNTRMDNRQPVYRT
jgi:hypothetical protein